MAEKVEVDIEVNSNLEPTIANLRELKKQLRLAAAGSAEFNRLSAAIRDTEDAIDGAKLGADDLAGALENAPGPIGNIAKGMKKVELATKSFGAAFKAIGIGLLVSTIGLLVTAFSKTEGSMKALEPVMIMLEKALGGLVQAFTPFITMFAELVADILPYAIEGIKIYYGALMSLFTLIKEAGTGAAKIIAGILTQDYDLANEGLKQLQGAWGKTTEAFNEFGKNFDEGYAKQSETEKKNAEEQAALQKEAADRRKASAEAAQKLREEQLAKAKAADAVELEAFKATLTERERLELEAALKLDEQKKVLLEAGRKDFTSIEEQYRITLAEIKAKYDEEEAKKQEELDKKAADDLKKKLEDERGIILNDLQARLEVLDRENQLAELDFQQDLERFAQQREILAQQEQTELLNTELTEFQKTEIRKKYADARQKITDGEVATEKAAMQAKHDINMAYLGLFEQFGSVLGQIAGKNKKLAIAGVVIQQAAAIGQIIANTAIANAKAVAATPLTGGMPFVAINTISAGLSIASTIAGAAKSIQQINAQPGGSGGSGGGGGGAPSSPPPSFGGGPASMGAPQVQTTAGASPTSQIAQTIGAAQNKPIVAQVVSTAVSSQQALDRRTNGASTFGGG
jgi:hypothetical protein